MFTLKGKFTEATVYVDEVEASCISQIQQMINHPSFTNPVRIMPDTHTGKGSVIGFTMPMGTSVIPNVVGVDIGCGVHFAKFPYQVLSGLNLLELDAKIREVVPFGHHIHSTTNRYESIRDELFKRTTATALSFTRAFNAKYSTNYKHPQVDVKYFANRCRKVGDDIQKVKQSLGTTGGGNHFIELAENTGKNELWLSIHCGSRHFGLSVANHHQKVAEECLKGKRSVKYQDEIIRIRNTYKGHEINEKIKQLRDDLGLSGIIPPGMEYLSGQEMFDYLMDMILAQTYASLNRYVILQEIVKILGVQPIEVHETVHNYINFSDMIIRKGAVASYEGELLIVPINMGYGSLLCMGKSTPEWNFSAPHGAGRILSRRAAKNTLDLIEFKEQMQGIASTSVCASTLDESPGAYKSPELIINSIEPTVTIIDRIVPILNLKDTTNSNRD